MEPMRYEDVRARQRLNEFDSHSITSANKTVEWAYSDAGLLQSSPKPEDFATVLELILTSIDRAGISTYHTLVEYSPF